MILKILGSNLGVLEAGGGIPDPGKDCSCTCKHNHDYRDGYNDGVKDTNN